MPRFFVDGPVTEVATVTGADAFHIARSLRMAKGEEVVVCDSLGRAFRCVLTEISDTCVTARVRTPLETDTECPFDIHLYMAMPKGDKLETVVQKAVELGALSVTPFVSSRCVKLPKADRVDRMTERLERIAREAAGQCGRSRLPRVCPPLSYAEACRLAAEADLALFCYEGESTLPIRSVLEAHKAPRTVAVMVGCEGGFSQKEAQAAAEAGMIPTGLGTRILRCETAPTVALSALLYAYEWAK